MKYLRIIFLLLISWAVICVAQDPAESSSITDRCGIAFNAFKAGEYQKAITEFEAAISSLSSEQRGMYKDLLADVYYHLALCNFNLNNYAKAAEYFKLYREGSPKGRFAEKSVFGESACYLEQQDYDKATDSYETALKEFPNTTLKIEYMMNLGGCYYELERLDDALKTYSTVFKQTKDREQQLQCAQAIMDMAVAKFSAEKNEELLRSLLGTPPKSDILAFLSPYILQVADQYYADAKLENALYWYHLVPPKQKVVEMYKIRLIKLQREYKQRKRRYPTSPETLSLEKVYKRISRGFKEFESMPDYTPSVYYRLGRVYYDREEFYESRLLHREVGRVYNESAEAPLALYGRILCNTSLNKPALTLQLAEEFTEKHPTHYLRDSVGYLQGEMLFRVKKYSNAVVQFTRELKQNPDSTVKDRMTLLAGHSHFMQEQFTQARALYDRLLSENPASDYAPAAHYRKALSWLYQKSLTNGLEQLEFFLARYPTGEFADDASFRAGEIHYVFGDYSNSLKYVDNFSTNYPGTSLGNSALMLVGDNYVGLMGMANSTEAFKDALTNAVDSYRQLQERTLDADMKRWRYAVFQEGQCYKFGDDDQAMIQLYRGFLTNYPKDEVAAKLLAEIADAYSREGRAIEADTLYRQAIELGGEDPTNDVADKCLAQYSQRLLRNAYSNEYALQLIDWADSLSNESLLRARIQGNLLDLYAQAGDTNAWQQHLTAIQTEYASKPYPATLAVRMGDMARYAGNSNEARRIYTDIVSGAATGHPYVRSRIGLGLLDMSAGEYRRAKNTFSELERYVNDQALLPQIIYGNGSASLALKEYTDAMMYLEQLLANRDWRGEYTAAALYGMGEIERMAGKDDSAHSYYQRIYVLYGAYREWVARAYLAAAQCLDRLGRKTDAMKTYAELLGREDLEAFTEILAEAEELSGLERVPVSQ